MKKAFTMIELIFVIVILGILAAVALPKFIGVAGQAHEANLKSFTGTLNRSVGASLWSKSLGEGKGGKISGYTDYNGEKFSALADIPKEIKADTIDLGNCNANKFDNSDGKEFAKSNTDITGEDYYIYCRDGNATNPPAFALVNKDKTCISGACDDYNNDTQ